MTSRDGQGLYNIVDLRPGAYTVTFTLAGFSTVKREGIELTSGVYRHRQCGHAGGIARGDDHGSGRGPVVDTQNVRSQTVLTREMLDTLPA